MQITKNFHSEKDKMNCKCCGALVYDSRFMTLIQIVRDIVGVPFIVTSFYRCSFHNNATGGVPGSRHLHGSAMDVSVAGWDGSLKWAAQFEAMKVGLSVGNYSHKGYFHFDLRPGKPILFP